MIQNKILNIHDKMAQEKNSRNDNKIKKQHIDNNNN